MKNSKEAKMKLRNTKSIVPVVNMFLALDAP